MDKSNIINTRKFYDSYEDIAGDVEKPNHYHIGIFESENDSVKVAQDRTVKYFERRIQAKEGEYILDIGCGLGLPAIQISQSSNCNIVGINISDKQLMVGEKLVKQYGVSDRVELRKMDAHNLEFEDDTFNGAYALESIMHMNQKQVVDEVYRILRKGSYFTLCNWYVKEPLTDFEKKIIKESIYGEYYNKEEYIDIFIKSKFKEIEVDDWSEKVIPMYDYWVNITEEMRRKISKNELENMKKRCELLSEIAKNKLGYLQVTMKKI